MEEVLPKAREYLMMNKVLLKQEKEQEEPFQRKSLFRTTCKVQGKCCKIMIDSGSTDNLVSIEMVEKLSLKKTKHPVPYKVSWLHKGHQILVSEKTVFLLTISLYLSYWEKTPCSSKSFIFIQKE